MQLESLKIFCDVADSKSFSKAAVNNGITQSAASQAVGQLERKLGVTLIDRSVRPLRLTPEGDFFFNRTSAVLQQYENIVSELQQRLQERPGKIVIAAIYSVGFQNLGRYIDAFMARFPRTKVQVDYLHPSEVQKRLDLGQADLGIVSFHNPQPTYNAEVWREEPMVLACLPSHSFAKAKSIKPNQLANERLIAFSLGLPIRHETDQFLERSGVTLQPAIELDNTDSVKSAVIQHQGVAILPLPTIRAEVENKLISAVNFEGQPFVRPVSIIYRKRRALTPEIRAFLAMLTESAGEKVA